MSRERAARRPTVDDWLDIAFLLCLVVLAVIAAIAVGLMAAGWLCG